MVEPTRSENNSVISARSPDGPSIRADTARRISAARRLSGSTARTSSAVERAGSRSPAASEVAAASSSRWRRRASLVSADTAGPATAAPRSVGATDVMESRLAVLAPAAPHHSGHVASPESSLCSAGTPPARGPPPRDVDRPGRRVVLYWTSERRKAGDSRGELAKVLRGAVSAQGPERGIPIRYGSSASGPYRKA